VLTERSRSRGFTLVELMVTITILALLLGLGAPSFVTYLASARIRDAATSVYGGIQKARAEAIRTNLPVEFVLTTDIPTAANVNGLTLSGLGRNWAIRVPNTPLTVPPTYSLLDSRLGTEGGGDAVVVNAGGTNRWVFNGLGGTTAAAAAVISFTHQNLNTACDLGHGVRCVNVLVSVGGQSRLCEPGRPATDARSC
jgi:type IV fimbrial biogenesis protein FimT